LHILVVEDCPDQARALTVLLRREGHEVSVAHNGFSGLAEALSYHPAVVLCDLGMPFLDGFGLVKRVRGLGDSYRPLLVAVTARGTEEDRRRCLQAGFDHHFSKPIDADSLLWLLREHRLALADPGAGEGDVFGLAYW
jgi:DNA-binding response OmpR family regulator